MVQSDFDILILGSGPSGVQAAKEATRHGVRVGLVDVGHEDHRYAAITPDRPFAELRRNDPNQQRYFLGEALEGVDTGDQRIGVGQMYLGQYLALSLMTLTAGTPAPTGNHP